MSNSVSKSPTISIQSHPFDAPESSFVVTALDTELASMYPDWDSLPHPGEDIGLANGAWNPKPSNSPTVVPQTVDMEPPNGLTGSVPSKSIQESVKPKAEGLHFFIAFASTMKSNQTTLEPIGCVALRLLQYFPFHHPASAFSQNRQTDIKVQIDKEVASGMTTAELKRLYVVPSHRSSATCSPSVATQLLRYAERYAGETMGVHRLVLETGTRQHAAVRLYEKEGWKLIDNFGDYISARTQVGGVSICYEKMLS